MRGGNIRYKHVAQKPYCCVPACVQMLLRRRKLPMLSQSDIGYNLGMILPPHKRAVLRIRSHRGPRPESGWGTRINMKKYSLGRFFKKGDIPLIEKYHSGKNFKSSMHLKEFVSKNLKEGNDILACFNYPLLYRARGAWGHASLIQAVSPDEVVLVDPGRKHKASRKVKTETFLKAMKNHVGGGLWVIKETPAA